MQSDDEDESSEYSVYSDPAESVDDGDISDIVNTQDQYMPEPQITPEHLAECIHDIVCVPVGAAGLQNDVCPICLEQLAITRVETVSRLGCGHCFCHPADCGVSGGLARFFTVYTDHMAIRCPACRTNVFASLTPSSL